MAEYVFTPEQNDLRVAVRRFCERHADQSAVRQLMDGDVGHDPAAWARLGSELGVLGLAVPEEFGGAGGGFVDQAVVAEEFGAALTPGPVVGTVGLAIPALVALAQETGRGDEVLAGLVDGTATAAFAVPDRAGRFDPALVTVTSDGERLTGEVAHVVDGGAGLLLVAARQGDEIGLHVTEGGERTPLSTLDRTRRRAHVRFDATPARRLDGDAAAAITSAFRAAGALLAAEQVGGAQKLLDTTVEYAKQRLQFGRPIGSFQAVKHRCADMLVLVEHARSAAQHAAWTLQDAASGIAGDDPDLAVSIAQAVCSQAYQRVATDTVQLHGGIGFTWEHLAHLYLKRAVTDAGLLGSAAQHREHIAAAVLDTLTDEGNVPVATG